MPNHIAPHKNKAHSTTQQRCEMVKLALQGHEKLQIDEREIKRNATSYTIDTLKEIRTQYPTTPLCFIMGMDSLIHFNSWHQWEDILNYCHLIICSRPQWEKKFNRTIETLLAHHQTHCIEDLHTQLSGHIYFQETNQYDISSTRIRDDIQHANDVSALLPRPVYDYIQRFNLYK